MPRIAFFTPLRPIRSGIAAYSEELLDRLTRTHDVDVFVDPAQWMDPVFQQTWHAAPAPFRLFSAHEFPWRRRRERYDLAVYQMGNNLCHEYQYGPLVHVPGLTVLHDLQLHQSRARMLLGPPGYLSRRGFAQYEEEAEFCHPGRGRWLAQIVGHALGGRLLYDYPLNGIVVRSSRAVAVHSPFLREAIAEEFPDVPVTSIRMGVREARPVGPDDLARLRARYGLTPDDIVVASFGLITPEKRILPALRVLQVAARYTPRLRYLLVGDVVPHFDIETRLHRPHFAGDVIVTGYRPDDELDAHLALADVIVNLRWPSARETSASLLRAMMAGKPVVAADLLHLADVPGMNARDLRLDAVRPIVKVDITEEEHDLLQALKTLTGHTGLRRAIGAAAREYAQAHHSLSCMYADYEAAIGFALEQPPCGLSDRSTRVPVHLQPALARVREDLAALGIDPAHVDFESPA